MNIIFFDNGGTLINDPFKDVLELLRDELTSIKNRKIFDNYNISKFLEYWKEENYINDFAFASHFIQEEIWICNALLRFNEEHKIIDASDITFLSLKILNKYRALARKHIKYQPQLKIIKGILKSLKKMNALICVASNDREFATNSMLKWAGLSEFFNHIFTSEGLSKKYRGAEKPSRVFFESIVKELGISLHKTSKLIYIGDSEKNDIIPLKYSKFITIRFFNIQNPTNALWIDHSKKTSADYHYSNINQLQEIISKILAK